MPAAEPAEQGLPSFLRKEGRYIILLLSLLLLFFFYPFFGGILLGPKILGLVFLFILLASIQSLRNRPKPFLAALGLALVGYGSFLAGGFVEIPALQVMAHLCFTLFFGFMTVAVVGNVWRVRSVTLDTILGSVCAYLLLGMTWTMACILIQIFVPGSYAVGGQPLVFGGGGRGIYPDFIYYSFVTLTTLGYGDVSPVGDMAQMFAVTEGIVGQLYLTIFVARLVALYVRRSQ